MRKPQQSFFLPGDVCDPGYLNIRRVPFVRPAKRYVERLWRVYAPYADRHFREDARKHFLQRYWEMYLAVALKDAGFTPVKLTDKGPEFFIEIDGRRVWVEAIAPGGGQGPDKVSEFPLEEAFNVPTEPVFAARSAEYDDPFAEYAVPQAALRFKQGFGRLIRRKSDRGVVAVLDRRIVSKSYGAAFLDSLPPCRQREAPLREMPALAAAWLAEAGNGPA